MCRLIVHELRPWPQYRQSSIFKLNQRYTECTLAVVKEGIASGEFNAGVPLRIVRDMIFGCSEHHTWSYLRDEGRFSPDEAADAITNLIYQGLAATAPAGTAGVDVSVTASSARCSASRGWLRRAGASEGLPDAQARPHCQPRRDRLPHHAHAARDAHRKRGCLPP